MTTEHPGLLAAAFAVPLEADPPLAGTTASTSSRPLASIRGVEIGIWEMTPGTTADVESDEVFVVLAGRARIRFVDPPSPTIDVVPGDVVRLHEGMRTEWTVVETLRKVYVA